MVQSPIFICINMVYRAYNVNQVVVYPITAIARQHALIKPYGLRLSLNILLEMTTR